MYVALRFRHGRHRPSNDFDTLMDDNTAWGNWIDEEATLNNPAMVRRGYGELE